MRIAMVSEHASPLAALGGPDAGGQNVYVARLAEELTRRGHQVTVYTRRDTDALPDRVALPCGAVVEHVPAGPAEPIPKDGLLAHMPAFGAYLARVWARERDRPEVVHAHFWMSGIAAQLGAEPYGIPVVQTFHALGTVKRRHQGAADTSPPERIGAERGLGRTCDRVLATCGDEVHELAAMGVPRRRVSVVPCGVDADHFRPDGGPGGGGGSGGAVGSGGGAGSGGGVSRSREGRRFGSDAVASRTYGGRFGSVGGRGPGGGPASGEAWRPPERRAAHRLLAVGRLVPRKGYDQALQALPRVPDTELLVAGGPPEHLLPDDPEAGRLLRLAEELGVADRVRLLGAVDPARMPDLLRATDLVLCTPAYEPFGIVPLEAMACGVPVVATDVGGHRDSVADRVTGRLVPPGDPGAIAAAVRELLDDTALRRRYGAAGRDRVLARFTWQRVALGAEQVYRQVVADREQREPRTEVA